MAYEKQNFKDNTVLYAAGLNNMDNEIENLSNKLGTLFNDNKVIKDILASTDADDNTILTINYSNGETKTITLVGNSLNFKIVGGEIEPTSPTENMIWVNTNTEITSWVFASEEPNPTENGMVWFYTGTNSPVIFNALKKNNIQVCPTSVKQYIDGQWLIKEAKTFKAEKWNEWIKYLYLNGEEYDDITGGWASYTPYKWKNTNMTAEKTASTLVLSKTGTGASSSNSWPAVGYQTNNLIGVAGHEKIKASYTSTGTYTENSVLYFYLREGKGDIEAENVASKTVSLANTLSGEITIDVSNVSGDYFLCIWVGDNTNTSSKFEVEITEIGLI